MASEDNTVKETVMAVIDKPPDNVGNQFGEASSVDKVTLNNKIISMRSTVKKSKVRILAKLIRHIKQLKSKIDEKPVNVEKNKRKHANIVEEMKVIKALKPDTISRFVLGNTCTFVELNNKGFQSKEARALARFSDENLLQDVVKKFRADHSDWKSLAAFVQTQSSGRNIKKKKRNKKSKTEKEETKTNIKAKQVMVSTFLQGKVNNTNSAEDCDSESDINISNTPDAESLRDQKGMIVNKNDDLLDLPPIDSELNTNQKTSQSDSNKEIQKSKQKQNSLNTNKTVNKLKNSKKESSAAEQQTKNSSANVAMVVKKINLDNFEDDILLHKKPATEDATEKLFGIHDDQKKEVEIFFFNGKETTAADNNKLEEVDEGKNNDVEFTMSGNHSMFLSLSGGDMPSFNDGRGRRGGMNSRSNFSEFRREKPNFQRHQNFGHQNNFGRGNFSNRGRRENASPYPQTKTFRESKEAPSKDISRQKLTDKNNLGDEKLHPSWEASRKRKEQAASISVFQGKKTTFDD